jgi:hypothetical protein
MKIERKGMTRGSTPLSHPRPKECILQKVLMLLKGSCQNQDKTPEEVEKRKGRDTKQGLKNDRIY